MTWIDNLKAIQPVDFNQTLINTTDGQLVSNVITNANDSTGGLWFIFSIFVLFIWLNYLLMQRQEGLDFDFTRSLFISSSWCLVISIIAALTTFSVTISPIIWFSTIFFITGVGLIKRKQQGK